MIEINNLSFIYTNRKNYSLNEITFKINDSEFVLIAGPSGCGKSTLCRCINGLIPSFYGGKISGTIKIQDINPLKTPTNQMAKKVGMVFQDPENQLIATDVEREIAFGLENLGFSKTIMKKRIEEVLDTVGIDHLRNRQINTLSGGEKQKVAIAAVLVLQPDILVLDEPTSELDPKGAEEVIQLVKRLNEEFGLTVLLIEHRIDRVLQFVDRLIIMKNGGISYDGNTRDWMNQIGDVVPDIGIPPISRLSVEFQKMKIETKTPLSIKEGRRYLTPVFKSHKFNKDEFKKDVMDKTSSNYLVKVKDLWFKYPNGSTILKNINFSISQGEFVSIIGRNASGKTTLVKMLNGLLKPTKGIVEINNIPTTKTSVEELARQVGFVFQDPNLHLFADTVEEEITFMMNNLGYLQSDIDESLEKMLTQFDLKYCRKAYPRSLSSGEKQRVALSSVLASSPKLLILDEPTRGLDYNLKKSLIKYLMNYQKNNGTIILITHDIELVAEFGQRVMILSEGNIIADGEKHEILSNSLHFSPQINRLIQPYSKYEIPSDILTIDEIIKGF